MPSEKDPSNEAPTSIKLYRRRWFILAIFVAFSASNAAQWIQYSIVSNVVTKYYGVESIAVDWTSMIYMITYIPFIFPASWLIEKKGLRTTTMIGSIGNCVGSWIKVLSVSPDRFYVTFIGQSIVAVSQVFVLSVPARLAAVWFGPEQVSSACAIGVFGNQLGIALGFLIPPMIVKNSENLDDIGHDLTIMFYAFAATTSVICLLIIIFFKAEPELPPSVSILAEREKRKEEKNRQGVEAGANPGEGEARRGNEFGRQLLRLITNKGYLLLLASYGINTGVFYAISTLLNQIVLPYYHGHEEDVGRIGLTIVVAGMGGSVISGLILDKTHKFKEITLALYALSLAGMAVYTFTLNCGYIAVVYMAAGLLGFFMTGYLPVGFEFAAELTHPEPEGTTVGILNAVVQVFGITFTTVYGQVFTAAGDFVANLTLAGALTFGLVLTVFIPSDLRRQAAFAKGHPSSPKY
ncbi:choline/ethanolamine transporter flvcr2a [Hetaerina americana]|uniref:choline/ethanolamine transporter flvcr2a n=1 Tax=Hetaerina americana TaxID=62018 RepID=UPI003A7F46CE